MCLNKHRSFLISWFHLQTEFSFFVFGFKNKIKQNIIGWGWGWGGVGCGAYRTDNVAILILTVSNKQLMKSCILWMSRGTSCRVLFSCKNIPKVFIYFCFQKENNNKTKQNKAKQSKAKQSKAKQSKAKQSKAKQSKAKHSKA